MIVYVRISSVSPDTQTEVTIFFLADPQNKINEDS